jgi:intracellular septation protein
MPLVAQRRMQMDLLIALFPVAVFFTVYRLQGIYAATVAIILALGVSIVVEWWRHRKLNMMLVVSAGFALVLGGITLALRNPLYIQWKFTIVYWLFAAAFLGSQFIGSKTLTERVMGAAIELESALWRQLNLMWVVAFGLIGAINLFVVYHYDEATWVNFKLFGTLGFIVVTALAQGVWITFRTRDSSEKN